MANYTKYLKNGTKRGDFYTKHLKNGTKPSKNDTKPPQNGTNTKSPYTHGQHKQCILTLSPTKL
jgi:hypothetical protein